jgi:hypothetical protein
MTAGEIITQNRLAECPNGILTDYLQFEKSLDLDIIDENLQLRTEVVDVFLVDFSNADIELIRILFDAELKCELETQRHDN